MKESWSKAPVISRDDLFAIRLLLLYAIVLVYVNILVYMFMCNYGTGVLVKTALAFGVDDI